MLPLLLLLALAGCGPSTSGDVADYTLTLTPIVATNQSPFDDLDSLALVVTPATGAPVSYDLEPVGSPSNAEVTGLPALENATLSLRGTAGDSLVSYGLSAPLSAVNGEASATVLVTTLHAFAQLASLPAASYGGAAASDGTGRFLLFGGNAKGAMKGFADDVLPTVWAFDAAAPSAGLAFSEVGEMPALDSGAAGRMLHTATLLTAATADQGKILVTGGGTNGVNFEDVSTDAFLWDPTDDTATAVSPMIDGRCSHIAVENQLGDVVVIGGWAYVEDGYILPAFSAETFSPSTGTFTEVNGAEGPFFGAAAASLGAAGVLVCGGFDSLRSGEFGGSDVCDLISTGGAVGAADPMSRPLAYASMAPLGDGAVLLTGGLDVGSTGFDQVAPFDASKEAWIYDANGWRQVGDMAIGRAEHGSALLPDGRVVVFGGITHTDSGIYPEALNAIACAEIFDPEDETFTALDGSMGECRTTDVSGPLPARTALPAFAVDPSFGLAVFGGLGPNSSDVERSVDSASLLMGCPADGC